MLRITHTPAEGTVIDGTSKGDGSSEVLKRSGWRWGRSLGAWYVPYSRDRQPKSYVIESTVDALRAAGFEVDVEIEAGHRDTAEVEADLASRREARADALTAKADRRAGAAERAWAESDAALRMVPEGGEPIKVGHHSERRHRRSLERAASKLEKAVEASEAAESAQASAESAAKSTDRRYNHVTVANRITRLEAEQRKLQRTLDGHTRTLFTDSRGVKHVDVTAPASGQHRVRIEVLLAETVDQLAYWRSIREEQVAAGVATNFGPESVKQGDRLLTNWGGWAVVTRVNRKTVTVEHRYGQAKVPYAEIKKVQAGE